MLLLTLACIVAREREDPAPEAKTPEASAEARPLWAEHEGYAPPPPVEVLHLDADHQGEVSGSLIACEAITTYRGDRQRPFAALQGLDTTKPEMDATFFNQGSYVTTHGPEESETVRFGAPAVHLAPGQRVRVELADRGVVRKKLFDVLEGPYGGELPMELQGEHSTVRCSLVPTGAVSEAVITALTEFEGPLARLDGREVDLDAPDFGREPEEDPRPHLMRAAGLVGWDDPQVQKALRRYEAAEARFGDRVTAALAAARTAMPEELVVDGLHVQPGAVRCPEWGFHEHGQHGRCGATIQVHRGGEGLPELELVGADGHARSISGWTVPPGSERNQEPRFDDLDPGEDGSIVIALSEPQEAFAIRVWGQDGPAWLGLPL